MGKPVRQFAQDSIHELCLRPVIAAGVDRWLANSRTNTVMDRLSPFRWVSSSNLQAAPSATKIRIAKKSTPQPTPGAATDRGATSPTEVIADFLHGVCATRIRASGGAVAVWVLALIDADWFRNRSGLRPLAQLSAPRELPPHDHHKSS